MSVRRANSGYRYLLGDSRTEARRLQFQSKLWDPVAHALFDRLRIRKNFKVLEVGPGRGSLHLELRQRVQAPIDAVERSSVFAEALASRCQEDGLGAGRIWNTDLLDAELPREHYDLIFARWVFLFLPDPGAHLKMLVRALKPGGRIAIQDYHRETLSLLPRLPEWTDFMAADRAFFQTQGGDVSIGGHLPALYKKAGLQLVDFTPTVKSGRPGSPVWQWISDYFLGVLPRYAELKPFSKSKAASLRRGWLKAAQDPNSWMIAPTLLDVVGQKPKRTRARPRT